VIEDDLARRLAAVEERVLFTAAVRLPTGERSEWQQGRATGDLLDRDDWAGPAAALAHPVRMLLLRQVLAGVVTHRRAPGAPRPRHHRSALPPATAAHRRRLAAGRGRYRVPPARVVPLPTVLAAVDR
jgi:hypothetical protein